MASKVVDAKLEKVAEKFAGFRGTRAGRKVHKYPEELWSEVAELLEAGLSKGVVCTRCGFSNGTLSMALGRIAAASPRDVVPLPKVKTLIVVPDRQPARCEIRFPNGITIGLEFEDLNETLIAKLCAC